MADNDERQAALLPPLYYLDHFEYLLSRVRVQYGFLLNGEETALLDTFAALPLEARALWVRLSLRRPLFFRVQRLDYSEITDLAAALARLQAACLVEPLGPAHGGELPAVLAPFPRAELLALADDLAVALPRSSPRPPLLEALLALPPDRIIAALAAREPVIRRRGEDILAWLLFLFFGRLDQGLEGFVLRDLGQWRFEPLAEADLTPRFADRREALDCYRTARLYDTFRELRQQRPFRELWPWFQDWQAAHPDLHPSARPTLERLALGLGRGLEREGCPETALAAYAATPRPPARERRVRLLHRLERRAEALALCREMLDSTLIEERTFAEEFLDRQAGARSGQRCRLLREADTVELEEHHRQAVERGVLEYMAAQGWQGSHTENHLWRGLFGLLLWDIVFDPTLGGLHHPLQAAPRDLFGPDFLPPRRAAIAARLGELDDPLASRRRIEATFAAKAGTLNPLVPWFDQLPGLIGRLLDHLTPHQLRGVLEEMARDPRDRGRGFPDLFLWREGDYRFVEVKAPGDTLSAYQWRWLQTFQKLGIEARVLAVRWRLAGPPPAP